MPLRLYQVVLPVSDIDQAEKFYSHLLGTPGRRVSPGQHHFECGGVLLIAMTCLGREILPKPPPVPTDSFLL